DRLEAEGRFTFSSMFSFLRDGAPRSLAEVRAEAVVTFLALLEMAKLRLVALSQPGGDGEIIIESAGDDLRARMEQTVARPDDYPGPARSGSLPPAENATGRCIAAPAGRPAVDRHVRRQLSGFPLASGSRPFRPSRPMTSLISSIFSAMSFM